MDIAELNRKAKILIREAWTDSKKWQESFDRAKEILKKALSLRPEDETTLINYGTILCDLGDHREAAQYFIEAINRGSEDKNAFSNLGIALINCGDIEKAMDYIKEANSKRASPLTWEAYFDPQAN